MSEKIKMLCVGGFVAITAVLLSVFGNPLNMGFCMACFLRDTAGALRLHTALQYARPEIIGIILGAFIISTYKKEFSSKGGSAPVTRFLLGFAVMIGALIFLGCPLRMLIRMAGGDLNAVVGLAGFVVGVLMGVWFLYKGYSLQQSQTVSRTDSYGWIVAVVLLLVTLLVQMRYALSLLATSTSGPASQYAPLLISLVAGLVIGIIGYRSRLCFIAGIRDSVLFKKYTMLLPFLAFVVIALAGNLLVDRYDLAKAHHRIVEEKRIERSLKTPDIDDIDNESPVETGLAFSQNNIKPQLIDEEIITTRIVKTPFFQLGFENQPVAHKDYLWNFLGLLLVGFGSVLLGGCPFRQVVLAGSGNSDSIIAVLGMISGAAFAHNFAMASSTAGVTQNGKIAFIVCLILSVWIATYNTFFSKKKG